MKKIKKLLSLICTLCIISTYAFVPSFGTNAVMAAAELAVNYLNDSKSFSPTSMGNQSGATVTGNGVTSDNNIGTESNPTAYTITGSSSGTSMTATSRISLRTIPCNTAYDTNYKVLHVGWTMSNPQNLQIDLRYQDSAGKYDLATWDGELLTDKYSGSKYSVTYDPTSYRGDIFFDLETREYRLYIDNVLFSNAYYGKSSTVSLKNLYFDVRTVTDSYSYTVSDQEYLTYTSGTTLNDVIAYTMAERATDNKYWTVNGIGNIGGTNGSRPIGNVEYLRGSGLSVDNNSLVVTTNESNTDSGATYLFRDAAPSSAYGCLPEDAENDNIIHQSLTIVPNISSGNYAGIGFRGNNARYGDKYKIGPSNGYVNNEEYNVDVLLNNKDFEYWILVDGEKRAHGYASVPSGIMYSINQAGSDTLTLSNVVTTSYDYTVSMDELLSTLVNPSNYNWAFDGFDLTNTSIASGYNTRYNRVTFTGNNSAGYTVTANEDAAYLGYRLGNGNTVALPSDTTQNNIIHQHLTFTPTFASGNKLLIGIRGNNAFQEELLTVNAENGFVSGQEYDMHIIINNKNRAYMFIVDGVIKKSGSTWSSRYPYWEIIYYIDKSGDSMILKDINTKYYNNTVSVYNLTSQYATSNAAFMDYLFETDANGFLAEELEEAACYDETKWKVSTSKRFFSGEKALAPMAQNTKNIDEDPNITLNLSFTANRAGTNTYYLWVRHTASVINQDGRNFFVAIDKDGTTQPALKTYTAEAKAPRWMLLGTIELDQDEIGYVKIRERQSSHVAWDKYVITTESSFVPTDSVYQIYPPSSSRAKNMGTLSSGRLAFEAENAGYGGDFELLDSYLDGNTYGWYSDYSNDKSLMISSGNSGTPTNWNDSTGSIDAGDIEFNFTPDSSGSVYLWARYYATSTSKKFAVSVNSNNYATVTMSEEDTKAWQKIATIDNVVAGIPVNIRIKNVAGGYVLDKFAISSNIFDTPSSSGPTWNTTSTTLSGGSPSVAAGSLPSHPRLYFTDNEVEAIESASHTSENKFMYNLNNGTYIAGGNRTEFTGEVPASPGYASYKPIAVTRIEALAYDYAINGVAESGVKAASSLINYITHVSYTGLESDEFTRIAGYDLYTLSKAYDWCYDCLTSAQKTAFINAGIKIASQLECGWPPADTSYVTGFASEGAFQSYLLAFAIAVADERPDIYNYVAGKVESDFVPANILLYNGAPMQGTRYGTYRGQHAFESALMLKTIGYENADFYNALANTAMNYIYARRPDGLLFVDGDDTNNGKTAYTHYDVGHMRTMLLHAIKLFGNYGVGDKSYLKDAAKWACYSSSGQFSGFDGTYGQESYVTPSTFLILNGNSAIKNEANYSLPLSRYFGSVTGSMIARTGWTEFTTSNVDSLNQSDNSAVAYMKAGVYNAGNHQHLDAGNFQLYYKGILANDPCYYTGTNYSSDYMNGYAKRSVAHNVVLVKDGTSNTIGNISYADGGQKAVSDASTLSDIANTASVEAYAIAGDDVNQPDFTYMKTYLKNAYNSSSVNNYKRSFMFMNMNDSDEPAALIVFDNLVTNNASHKTSWLLHGLTSPTISGNRSVFTTTTGGKMTNDTLLPASVTINKYADGYVDSSHNYSSGYTTESGKVNESEGYRIEVSPSTQTTQTYYLNVIQAGDSSVTAATPVLIDSTNFYGVRLKDRVALFGKDLGWFGETKEQEYLFNFSSSDGYVYKFAIADAYAGSYEIYYSANGSNYSLLAYAKTTDSASHLLTFSGKAGYYKVVRKSNTTGGATISFAEQDELKQLSPAVKITQSGSNYIISASAKTYRSYAKADSNTYANKIILAAYDATGKVLGLRVVDFTSTDKEADYVDIATLTSAPSGKITVKSMIFDGLGTINPLTARGKVDFLN